VLGSLAFGPVCVLSAKAPVNATQHRQRLPNLPGMLGHDRSRDREARQKGKSVSFIPCGRADPVSASLFHFLPVQAKGKPP